MCYNAYFSIGFGSFAIIAEPIRKRLQKVFLTLMYVFIFILEYNITFHANKTTWNEAVVHCANIGGAIYSDEFDIRKRYEDELNNTDEVWTGKYQAFSPWRITWGNSTYIFY